MLGPKSGHSCSASRRSYLSELYPDQIQLSRDEVFRVRLVLSIQGH